MRILHVIPSLALCHGGPSVVLPIMERALLAGGMEVETITTDDEGPGRRNGKGDGTPREENGIVRRYFPKQTEFYKVSFPLARWMRKALHDFDVVHIHALFSHTSIAAARAARSAGVPYVIRPLGVLNQYGITQRRALLKQLSL
ncbi:MAG: glycosyltransferase, partial [Verrucomicrobiales bacterium]